MAPLLACGFPETRTQSIQAVSLAYSSMELLLGSPTLGVSPLGCRTSIFAEPRVVGMEGTHAPRVSLGMMLSWVTAASTPEFLNPSVFQLETQQLAQAFG